MVFCVSFNSIRGIVHFVFLFYHRGLARFICIVSFVKQTKLRSPFLLYLFVDLNSIHWPFPPFSILHFVLFSFGLNFGKQMTYISTITFGFMLLPFPSQAVLNTKTTYYIWIFGNPYQDHHFYHITIITLIFTTPCVLIQCIIVNRNRIFMQSFMTYFITQCNCNAPIELATDLPVCPFNKTII